MTRTALPFRRQCVTMRFVHAGLTYFGTVGFSPDESLSDIFIDCRKIGSDIQASNRDLAIAVSIALQHGSTIDELRHAFTRSDTGEPATAVCRLLDLVSET